MIDHVCEHVSRLKVRATLFLWWFVTDCIERDAPLQPIDTKLITNAFAVVSAKQQKKKSESVADMEKRYEVYKERMGIKSEEPLLPNISQILEHTKNELVTVMKNCIVLNFEKRARSCIRWEIINILMDCDEFRKMKNRNVELAKLVGACLSCVIKDAPMETIDPYFTSLFPVEYCQDIKDIIAAHHRRLQDITNGAMESVLQRKQAKAATAQLRNKNEGSKEAEKKMDSSTTNKSKRKRATKSDLDQVLDTLPHFLLRYLHWASGRLHSLPLSQQFTSIKHRAFECRKNKELCRTVWKEWKWGKKVKMPEFKLLPICHTKKHFIRIDRRQLELWGLVSKEAGLHKSEKWWYEDVFDIYGRVANIRPLRRYQDVRSPKDMMLLCDLISSDGPERLGPYIPGPSIQTDGMQVKVQVMSLRHVTPNLHKLFERGYSGIPSNPSPRTNINQQTRGVFQLKACRKLAQQDVDNDATIMGIDPGGKLVLTYSRSTFQSIIGDRVGASKAGCHEFESISNKDYHDKIGTTSFQKFEERIRHTNKEYMESIDRLSATQQRTTDVDQLVEYIRVRLMYEPVREVVMFDRERRGRLFNAYRRQQRALAQYVKKILGNTGKKIIVFMGNGTFAPGGHGYAPVPKKKFIRALAQHAVVILVDEYNTSKCCPLCFQELSDYSDSECDETEHRLRVCPTIIEDSPCLVADRDAIGSMNIMQKGVHTLIGSPLQSLERGVINP